MSDPDRIETESTSSPVFTEGVPHWSTPESQAYIAGAAARRVGPRLVRGVIGLALALVGFAVVAEIAG